MERSTVQSCLAAPVFSGSAFSVPMPRIMSGRRETPSAFRPLPRTGYCTHAQVARLSLLDLGGSTKMRILGIVALGAALTGCVTNNETVQFRTSNPQQQAIMRDGQPALVSRQKNSL